MARIAFWLAAALGVAANVILAARGGAYDLSGTSGVLIAAATGIAALGLGGLALLGRESTAPPAERSLTPLVRAGVLVLIAGFTGASLVAASLSGSGTVRSAAAVVPAISSPEVVAAAGAPAETPETHAHETTPSSDSPLGEGDAHSHGTEVHVTTARLAAAAKFVQDVKAATAQYEDIRAGMAAGYVQLTQDLPGIAAHFVNLKYLNDNVEMDPARPEFLLYSKRLDGTWKLVGTMFYALPRGDTPPSFFGPLDVWHRHENLCFQGGGVKVAASQADCPGGLFTKETNWQLHVWTADGGTGVFAHDYAPISPGAFPGATRPAAQDLVTRD